MKFLADERILFESPNPAEIFCYSPALCHGFDNRIVAAVDLGGPGTSQLDGPRSARGDARAGNQIRIFLSDDHGSSWRATSARIPMLHENLFRAGKWLYLVGQCGPLAVSRSDDNGEHWSPVSILEDQHSWCDGVGRVNFHGDRVYVPYGRAFEAGPWSMPMVLSACVNDDLTRKESWTISEPFDPRPIMESSRAGGIPCVEFPGIIEGNLTRIYDEQHEFYDPSGQTMLLFYRTSWERLPEGMGNLGAVLRCVEDPVDGKLRTKRLKTRDGRELFYLPWPGGAIKFNLDYDPTGKCYWMVASQPDGVHSPRRRLGLYFSRNAFDWNSAGIVAEGPSDNGARNYAALLIDGEDLLILSRSGDERAKSDHDNNLVTLHTIKNFRSLAY
ncbi:MAG: sialidase family protein [Victivallaceae bacterium]|nr:sialidase family protein [Victivallaceae bacterium]